MLELKLTDSGGRAITVGRYQVSELGASTEMYSVLNPGFYTTGRMNILVGCSMRDSYIRRLNEKRNNLLTTKAAIDKAFFEESLFVSWGDMCIDAQQDGEYKLSVELKDGEYVVFFPDCPNNTKTFTGKLLSNPFQINLRNFAP
jgi:hypothetical protein